MNAAGAQTAGGRDPEPRCRRIEVAPESSHLSEIRQFVESIGAEQGLDNDRIFDLKVAVSEACANAVEHSGAEKGRIQLCAKSSADSLVFEICDSGDFRMPRLEAGMTSDTRGLGLPLMLALMDEVCISKLPGGGTKVVLAMYLGDRSQAESATG